MIQKNIHVTQSSMKADDGILGKPHTIHDDSQSINIQNPSMPPDRIIFDFKSGEIIWETPEKRGTDSFLNARELRPLIFDILGEGKHDLSKLVDFVNIIAENDELVKKLYDAQVGLSTESLSNSENEFNNILNTVEIKATVLERTYQSLKVMMSESGGTMGDVIDKMSIHFSPHEFEIAVSLAMEELRICLSGLDSAETKEAYMEVAATLMGTMTKEEREIVFEKTVDKQHELFRILETIDKNELKKLFHALKKLFGKR